MKIVIAPGSFKGSLNAIEVAETIAAGCLLALPNAELIRVPMADGGDGMLDCLLANNRINTIFDATVTDPLGGKVKASYGIQENQTAIIEMAKASGLSILPLNKRHPLEASTYGTGELILHALDQGCRRFIIGLGGSATCDGGVGALAALGVQFKNTQNQEIAHNAAGLKELAKIDISKMDPRLQTSKFILACDIDNPLQGARGAVLYAPQKGATPKDVELIQQNLEHYAMLLKQHTQKEMGLIPHGGAAGGLAAGLYAFLNAELTSGAATLIREVNLDKIFQNADLVITAEGQIDHQSIYGKTPIAIAKLAKKHHIPVIAIAARLGIGYEKVYAEGIDAVFSFVNKPLSNRECFKLTKPLLNETAYNIARILAMRIKI